MPLDPWLSPRAADAPAVLSLGCMNFGARTPASEAVSIIDAALEAGIGLLDTANVYGDGLSEKIIGEALRGRRDAVRIASKVGLMRTAGRAEGLSPARVLAACAESLERLQTDHIDLYYLHAPDPDVALQETLSAIAELLAKGKILSWGVSNYASWQILELQQMAASLGLPPPTVAQQLYNVLVRQLDIEYFPFTRRHPIHTTVYNPLAGGLLAGGHQLDVPPPKGSRFDKNRMYRGRYWRRALFDAVDTLSALARDEGMTLLSLAYTFALGHPGVDSVLVGPATLAHLEEALAARTRALSPEGRSRAVAIGQELVGTDASYAR